MIESVLGKMICIEFEKAVGKAQDASGKAMHMSFNLNPENGDEYRIMHMYVYSPDNYVYVAIQGERIDDRGRHEIGKMKIISYHDSCWKDAIQRFVFENRKVINTLTSRNSLSEWYDIISLTKEEKKYLYELNEWNIHLFERLHFNKHGKPFNEPNPFDKRGIWMGLNLKESNLKDET